MRVVSMVVPWPTGGVPHLLPEILAAGAVVGMIYGIFGVGSAFATPVLAVLGVPGLAAVVAPLPALLPGSAVGAWQYSRQDRVDWVVARWALLGGAPAAVLGALASQWVGGGPLIVASGVMLVLVGLRILRPVSVDGAARAAGRREKAPLVIGLAAVVGFTAGLLANGGGFLLVPLFLVLLGFELSEATGTSLVVAAALTVPTLVTHLFLGDIVWPVTLGFAAGFIPGAAAGARVARGLPQERLRPAFGVLLVAFAVWFLGRNLLG